MAGANELGLSKKLIEKTWAVNRDPVTCADGDHQMISQDRDTDYS